MNLPAFAPAPVINPDYNVAESIGVRKGVKMERELNVVEEEFNSDQTIDATTDVDKKLEKNLFARHRTRQLQQ